MAVLTVEMEIFRVVSAIFMVIGGVCSFPDSTPIFGEELKRYSDFLLILQVN